MPLITILSDKEEKEFNSIPRFNIEEQKHFFKLPYILDKKVISYDESNRILFILMFGCFKATNRFFPTIEY